eukprot:g78730.t1
MSRQELAWEAANGNLQRVKDLLAQGVSADSLAQGVFAHSANATALMLAARHGHTEVGRLLLARKADVNATDQDQWTALMFAAMGGSTELGQLLLEVKADLHAADKVTSEEQHQTRWRKI